MGDLELAKTNSQLTGQMVGASWLEKQSDGTNMGMQIYKTYIVRSTANWAIGQPTGYLVSYNCFNIREINWVPSTVIVAYGFILCGSQVRSSKLQSRLVGVVIFS